MTTHSNASLVEAADPIVESNAASSNVPNLNLEASNSTPVVESLASLAQETSPQKEGNAALTPKIKEVKIRVEKGNEHSFNTATLRRGRKRYNEHLKFWGES